MSQPQAAPIDDVETVLDRVSSSLDACTKSQLIASIDWLLAGVNYVKPTNQPLLDWLLAFERQIKRITA